MKTILITNDTRLAQYAEDAGVSRIMVDLEVLGKEERQGHLDTVISKHSMADVSNIRSALTRSDLFVRVNPMNELSADEINRVIELGADIVMLPMFKSPAEVTNFIEIVDGRAKACLLLETSQALVRVDDILAVPGIDEIHIGLNDLHLSLGLDFMFELLSGGVIEYLSEKIKKAGVPFGFGGIARVGSGKLDSSLILSEHARLGSELVILSRDFKGGMEDYEIIATNIDMHKEVKKVHQVYRSWIEGSNEQLTENKLKVKYAVQKIIKQILG